MVVSIGSSIDFMFPQGTPPTMIAYSTGKYKVKEMVKIGFIVDIDRLALLTFVLPFLWKAFGVASS